MKKFFYNFFVVAFVILLVICLILKGQDLIEGCVVPKAPTTSQSVQTPVCTTLTGRVCVALLFVDDDMYTWTASEVTDFERTYIQPGVAFLQEQAAAYDVDLTLTTATYMTTSKRPIYYDGFIEDGYTYREESGKMLIYPDNNERNHDILDRVAVNWGYQSEKDMRQALLEYNQADQIAYIVIPNRDGWAYAKSGGQQEYCLVYARDHMGREQARSTFPHELLHLFGAEDLYKATQMDGTVLRENRASMTEQMHKDAIMNGGFSECDGAIICGYTAYKIGWLDEIPPEYNCEEWFS